MAELIVEPIQTAELESSGYIGQPEGNIDLTENNVQVNVAPYKYATPKIPEPSGTKEITENGLYDVFDYAEADVQIPPPKLEEKQATPSTTPFDVEPSQGYDGLSKVTVNPTPLEVKTVTPSTEQQTITPTAPNIGLSSVTVDGVTADVDANITAGNIKKDVSILAVTGTYEGNPNANLDAYIRGDLVNIVTNASLIASSIFRNTSIISVSMLHATEIGRQAFFYCGSLVNVDLSNNLTTIKESAFQGDNKLEISELPDSLLNIESSAFNGCSKLAITKLPKNLTVIYSTAFSNCTSIPYLDVSEVLQIPVLSSSNAFLGTTFPFYFADQTQLNSWAAASNWSVLASRFQIKPSGV